MSFLYPPGNGSYIMTAILCREVLLSLHIMVDRSSRVPTRVRAGARLRLSVPSQSKRGVRDWDRRSIYLSRVETDRVREREREREREKESAIWECVIYIRRHDGIHPGWISGFKQQKRTQKFEKSHIQRKGRYSRCVYICQIVGTIALQKTRLLLSVCCFPGRVQRSLGGSTRVGRDSIPIFLECLSERNESSYPWNKQWSNG